MQNFIYLSCVHTCLVNTLFCKNLIEAAGEKAAQFFVLVFSLNSPFCMRRKRKYLVYSSLSTVDSRLIASFLVAALALIYDAKQTGHSSAQSPDLRDQWSTAWRSTESNGSSCLHAKFGTAGKMSCFVCSPYRVLYGMLALLSWFSGLKCLRLWCAKVFPRLCSAFTPACSGLYMCFVIFRHIRDKIQDIGIHSSCFHSVGFRSFVALVSSIGLLKSGLV